MTVLKPNSIAALVWGLKNFDGVEFDVRISKDDVAVIHHDTYLEIEGALDKKIQDLTLAELREHGIETLEELLNNEGIAGEMTDPSKILWLELKPDCKGWERILYDAHVERMYKIIDEVIEKSSINRDQINVFSFCVKCLIPFLKSKKYKVFPIVPDVDECDTRIGILRQILALGRLFKRSLIYHGKRFENMGFKGMLFPHNYVDGFIHKLYHPNLKKVIKTFSMYPNFDLITLAKTLEEEEKYEELIRFTDVVSPVPRMTNNYKNHIAIHRGCGTEEIDV
ncbi:MAG: hypothetical protein INQ03_16900 [Candidatus Heimdallarchaeota archaeon]|nr:hypothetical protein [Candidatus Heimdallarchaeota archaeon]